MNELYSFNKYSITPSSAKSIGIFDQNGDLKKTFSIGKMPKQSGQVKYRFGVLADTHQNPNQQSTDENLADLSNALSVLSQNEGVDCVCIAGDVTNDGCATATQIQRFAQAIAPLNVAPVYTVAGNHDCTQSGFNSTSLANWKTYTIDNVKSQYNGSQTPQVVYSDSKLAYYFKKQVPGTQKYDYFVFLGMNIWNFSGSVYLDNDIQFVSNLIKGEASEARCFVFTHPFFPERAGNLHLMYSQSNVLRGQQLNQLQKLCDEHPNTIWFSGHSHWKQYLAYQPPSDNDYRGVYSNVWHEQTGGGWTVHVASCAYPRDAHYDNAQQMWVSDASQDWTSKSSEGMVVDVYEDKVVIRGISFKAAWSDGTGDQGYSTKYLPCGMYGLSAQSGIPIPIPAGSETKLYFYDGTNHTIIHKQTEALDRQLLVDEGLINPMMLTSWEKTPSQVEIGNRVSCIGSYVFESCQLTSVYIPTSVEEIRDNAFSYSCIANVEIPGYDCNIYDNAFYSCQYLNQATLYGGDMQYIGDYVFYNCDQLQTVYATNKQMQHIDADKWGLGFGDNGVHTVVVYCSDGILVINGDAESSGGGGGGEDLNETYVRYYDLTEWRGELTGYIDSTSIPELWKAEIIELRGIDGIEPYCFQDCYNLREITIPNSVQVMNIGYYAFYGCDSLNIVFAYGMAQQDVKAFSLDWGLGIGNYGTHTVVVYCSDGIVVINGDAESSESSNQ